MVNVLRQNGVSSDLEATAKQVILVMRRRSNVRLYTEDLVEAGFDKVWSVDLFDGLLAYSAGLGGPDTLAEIRRVIDGIFDRQWLETYELVRALPTPPSSQSSAYWWCTHNRVLYAQARLPTDKAQMLERISWWRWAEAFEERWQARHDEIRLLPECPRASTSEYGWVRQQRRLREKGTLEPYKIRLLELIPWWTWETTRDTWDIMLESLMSLSGPPARETKEYEWMRTQRKAYKARKLSEDRVSRLEMIPWWSWGDEDRSREVGLIRLKELIESGVASGKSKKEVRQNWAATVNVGPDQVYKYLRCLSDEHRAMWDRLGDARLVSKSRPVAG